MSKSFWKMSLVHIGPTLGWIASLIASIELIIGGFIQGQPFLSSVYLSIFLVTGLLYYNLKRKKKRGQVLNVI